jgi:bifunctional ADP-heptose synthase (sugar kinase/adenylyltransferase)
MNEQVKKQILIAGDVMLDRYWFGEVNRISPEARFPSFASSVVKNVLVALQMWL